MPMSRHNKILASFVIPFILLSIIIGFGGSLIISLKDIETKSIRTEYYWRELHTSTFKRFSFQPTGPGNDELWRGQMVGFESSLEDLRTARGGWFLGPEIDDRINRSYNVWEVTKRKLLECNELYMQTRKSEEMSLATGSNGSYGPASAVGWENQGGNTRWQVFRLNDSLTNFDVSGDVFTASLSQITDEIRTKVRYLIYAIISSMSLISAAIIYSGFLVSKRADEAIRQQVQQLQEMDKLKDDFLRNISHELKSPIVPLKGYVNMICGGALGDVTPEQKEALDVCEKSCARLEDLIDGLVNLTRLESGKIEYEMEDVSIETVLEEVAARYRIVAEKKGLNIEWSADGAPHIRGDRKYLISVVENIFTNAIKFTSEGGISARVFADGDNAHLEVKDTGEGIDKMYHEKVFERLFQVDSSPRREGGGLGFGLAISKKIVEDHGGRIWVESEKGRGSTFHMELPGLHHE